MTVRAAVEATELQKAANPGAAMAEAVTEGRVKAGDILRAVGIDPRNPNHQAALLVAQKYGLDPLMRHVLVLPKGSVPYITRDGYLHIAHRSGDLDGIEVLDESETSTHYIAKAAVWRKSMTRPFSFIGKYPKSGANREFAEEMALTRAVRRSLKHAFDVSDDPLLAEHAADWGVDVPEIEAELDGELAEEAINHALDLEPEPDES